MFAHERDAGCSRTFSVEAVGHLCKYMHDFVYLRRNVNHDVDLPIEIDRCTHNA